MSCPHESANTNGTITCAILNPPTAEMAGPNHRAYHCDRCRSEWTDGPPDPDDRSTWTPTLVSFAEPFDMPQPGPRGLGDTVANVLAKVGIPKWKGCGCSKRQEWLNKHFPYGSAK
jgi:hypothetical protein